MEHNPLLTATDHFLISVVASEGVHKIPMPSPIHVQGLHAGVLCHCCRHYRMRTVAILDAGSSDVNRQQKPQRINDRWCLRPLCGLPGRAMRFISD